MNYENITALLNLVDCSASLIVKLSMCTSWKLVSDLWQYSLGTDCNLCRFNNILVFFIVMWWHYPLVVWGVFMRDSIYRVAQNKIPHQTICNIFATSDQILKILEAV